MGVAQLVFLHAILMIAALGLIVFPGILLQQIALSGDAGTIRKAYQVGRYHGPLGTGLLALGIVAGFFAAGQLTITLGTTWLVVAYVAVGIILLVGLFFHRTHEERILAAASTGEDNAGAECRRIARSPFAMIANTVSGIAWIVALYVMIVKPA